MRSPTVNIYRTNLYSIGLLLLFFSFSCATSEPAVERPVPAAEETEEEFTQAELEAFTPTEQLLYEHRTHLSDRFSSIETEIPDSFLRETVIEEPEIDETAGFRVQIISTRDVALADSVRDEFRVWAAERIEGYQPEAYIFFRQPYYRVRVGDFNNRRRAINFSNMLKNRYPDAWIVHDRINPELTPADTARVQIRTGQLLSD